MTQQASISVILPFYKPGKRFETCIKSILNQSFKHLELILVNNNSDTTSTELAKHYQHQDERIVYLEAKRQGVVHATQAGLDRAKGRYIARMDADDVAYPEKLQMQFTYLENHPEVDLVGCQVKYIPNDVQGDGFRHYVSWSNSLLSYHDIYTNRFVESPIVNPSILFRRTLLERHELYHDGDFPEDYELFLRWLQAGVRMCKLPSVLLEWHDGHKRLTRTDQRYAADAFFKIKSKYAYRYLKSINPQHPKAVIWGAGRLTRKRLGFLKALGLEVEFYIDLYEKQHLDAPCISYKHLPAPGKHFIISMVSNRGARQKIESQLIREGYEAGINYLLLA